MAWRYVGQIKWVNESGQHMLIQAIYQPIEDTFTVKYYKNHTQFDTKRGVSHAEFMEIYNDAIANNRAWDGEPMENIQKVIKTEVQLVAGVPFEEGIQSKDMCPHALRPDGSPLSQEHKPVPKKQKKPKIKEMNQPNDKKLF